MKTYLITALLLSSIFHASSQNLSRKVEFQLYGKEISLNNNFIIQIINRNNDTLELIPEFVNTIKIPFLFCNNDSFKCICYFNKYRLFFSKIAGSDLNYDVKWKFEILKYPYNNDQTLLNKTPKEVEEIFIWEFEPYDKDGWVISEPNYYSKFEP